MFFQTKPFRKTIGVNKNAGFSN